MVLFIRTSQGDEGTGGVVVVDPGAGMSLGSLLRMWRRRALLTQEQVAERAGLNVRTVRRLENRGLPRPRATSVLLLAKALELDGAELELLHAAARADGPDEPAASGGPARPCTRTTNGGPTGPCTRTTNGGPTGPCTRTTSSGPTGPCERTASGGPVGHGESPAAGPRPWAVPRQLPADVAVPGVRERELAIMMEHHSVVCVDGMAGMGKTTLAVRAAHRLAPQFPDGQLFVNLHAHAQATAPVDPGTALARVLRALGVPGERIPRHPDDRAALYRSVLAGRRILVVLDDAAGEHQLDPLLPADPGCRVLITSRRRLACPGNAGNLSLDDLPVTEAVALFTRLAGRERDAGTPVDVLVEVVRRCGLLPLAIRIAAARFRTHPSWDVRHLLDRLATDRLATDRLAELVAGRHSVAGALDRSYERLPAEHRQVYRLLGSVVRPVFGLDAVATLLDVTTTQARRLLDELLDAHLLQEPAPGRYRLHDLVRGHASALWLSAGLSGSEECEVSAFEEMAGVRLGAE